MPTNPTLGEALRAVRKALGLGQAQLAAKLNVSRETISAWELGHTAPAHQDRIRAAQELGQAPSNVLVPLMEALGVATPRALARSASSPEAAAQVAEAVRLAADELDVAASVVRSTLGVVLRHLAAANVTLDDVAAALKPAKPERPSSKRAPASRR